MCRTSDEVNPVVIGRLGRCRDKPTVCVYGHYDIQPAMEREWQTDPFELTVLDGYYYGRGTSDNKVCVDLDLVPAEPGQMSCMVSIVRIHR